MDPFSTDFLTLLKRRFKDSCCNHASYWDTDTEGCPNMKLCIQSTQCSVSIENDFRIPRVSEACTKIDR